MIENYKGWDITLTWDDNHSFITNSYRNTTYNQKEKWKGVNLNGNSIYGASLKAVSYTHLTLPTIYSV